MQGVFAESSLRKQAWRNPKEGRVGCLHQDIFTTKVTDIAFTSNFCNNYSHPASPASMYLTSLCPRPTLPRPILPHVPYLMSSRVVPKSYRPKGQPRSTRNELPIRADFGNSRKHPIWRLKRGENWQPKEPFYRHRSVIYGIVDEVCVYCEFWSVLGPV